MTKQEITDAYLDNLLYYLNDDICNELLLKEVESYGGISTAQQSDDFRRQIAAYLGKFWRKNGVKVIQFDDMPLFFQNMVKKSINEF